MFRHMIRTTNPCRPIQRYVRLSTYKVLRQHSILTLPLLCQQQRRRQEQQILQRQWNSTSTAEEKHKPTYCPGCGAPFQKDRPGYPGYVSPRKPATIPQRKHSKGLDNEAYDSLFKSLDPTFQALLEGREISDKEKNNSEQQQQVLQTTNDESQSNKNTPIPVCQRCHQLVNNNRKEGPDIGFLKASQQHTSLSFLHTKQRPLILYVMDITDMPWSLESLKQILNIQPEARVMIVANKVDLLPKSVNKHEQRIRDYILSSLKQQLEKDDNQSGVATTRNIQSISLISATKSWGMKGLLKRVQQNLLPTDDLYVMGSVNAGKSALIHQFLSQSRSLDKKEYRTTSSSVPGTTIGMIRIPLHVLGISTSTDDYNKSRLVSRDHYLIDTPGMIDTKNDLHPMMLATEMQQKLVLNKNRRTPLKPTTFRLYQGQSIVLGKARIDVLMTTNKPVLMTLFTPLAPHITKTIKLEDKDLIEPLDGTVIVQSHHHSHASADLAFAGIGWIALTGGFGKASFKIWLPKGISEKVFSLREPSFLPFEYHGQIRKFFGSGKRATS
ncbi:uncharacterized protein BX664DRAFT_330426 [Halteromyces radiatus]|uniref:uncharacterized protein n=1 Tax=Halteromyces radiatus TaxID=101107 RepID=UPI00222075A6|nr:uncharacterized protein BX664DRAFT_330426 [Halteromyces radiatus]KAI8093726.1 hypothetical protein BX664DRAFT_330426 [Halteromyces radiatus]